MTSACSAQHNYFFAVKYHSFSLQMQVFFSKYTYICIFCINYNCLFNSILLELEMYVEENSVFLRYEVYIVQISESCMSDSPLLVAVV